ncbi:MmcQ/YjbR family DNA-binding protein [Danxiaibacter flavus]|uniref:MmcQ/YjbR family DNA-binding protein n=1 Tax=Danxiaibacter flavus TaxID=3049108 RepID=A0ABV3ZCY0_9BACT|nr:MmcQ/YjbR family DNA-binding protein [Chitinophagaceae bacterium DXS]
MTLEALRSYCISLPHVTETVQWGDHLVFKVGEKVFCIASGEDPLTASFKVEEETFFELTERNSIVQAPYLAKKQWVLVEKPGALKVDEWKSYIYNSYKLVVAKLTKKLQKELGLNDL